MKNARVVRNNRYEAWYAIWSDDDGNHSQKLGDFRSLPSRLDVINRAVEKGIHINSNSRPLPTVNNLVEGYRQERQSKRFSTQYSESQWPANHIIPKWGKSLITDLQPRDVERWLKGLALSPKNCVHIRSIISRVWDYGMWARSVPRQRNPMELVVIKDATKRVKPRSLSEDEFRKFAAQLPNPYHTIALIEVTLGLRIPELLALRWSAEAKKAKRASNTEFIVDANHHRTNDGNLCVFRSDGVFGKHRRGVFGFWSSAPSAACFRLHSKHPVPCRR